ncbi:MAG TPA: DUF4262 domain-containing protein [Amycolatopsis sp.]|nr:DUF4262 domain-containing protein [Amycolatopsis sp.]
MCEQCDYPGRAGQEYVAEILARIDEHGWCVQGVLGTDFRPPWAYTVGLTARGLPELLVVGLAPNLASALLTALAEHALSEGPPRPGEVYSMRRLPSVEIVAVAEPSAHLLIAAALYGREIQALQLVHADEAGRFPWSPSYRDGRGGQPVLGARADG